MGGLRCYRDPCPSHLFLPIHGVFKRSDGKAVCSIASIPVPNAVLDDPDSPLARELAAGTPTGG